jgi:hypothetical protein
VILVNPGDISGSLPVFAERTIWFGRRGDRNIAADIRYE